VRLDLDYPTLVEMIEAKIGFQEKELPRQFASAFGR
jgi:hypothetical protein